MNDPIICFCYSVRESTLINTILSHSVTEITQLTQLCKAGNGCTSCWQELEQLILDPHKTNPPQP
jgi:bacterioferritin-associated ferredoxin